MPSVLPIDNDDRIPLSLAMALQDEGYMACNLPTAEEDPTAQRLEADVKAAVTVSVDLTPPGIDGFERLIDVHIASCGSSGLRRWR